jgi:hypothetical protein
MKILDPTETQVRAVASRSPSACLLPAMYGGCFFRLQREDAPRRANTRIK